MWVWIVVAGLFLFLLGRSLHEGMSGGGSRVGAFLGVVADGLSMICAAIGVFGLLMALVLGVFADAGPRLTGDSLRDVIIWSVGFILLAVLLLFAGIAARKLRGRPRAARAGH